MTEIKRTFVAKPWGAEDWLIKNEHYVAKHLYINAGEQISLQYHNEKHESMIILEGMGQLVTGRTGWAEQENEGSTMNFQTVTVGDIFTIQPKTIHQIRAHTGLKILEISTPQTEDLVRIGEDKYGRK